jgi:hypothetical protein
MDVMPTAGNTVTVAMLLHEEEDAKAKPHEVMQVLLDMDEDQLCALRVCKHEAFVREETGLVPLMQAQPRVALAQEVSV